MMTTSDQTYNPNELTEFAAGLTAELRSHTEERRRQEELARLAELARRINAAGDGDPTRAFIIQPIR